MKFEKSCDHYLLVLYDGRQEGVTNSYRLTATKEEIKLLHSLTECMLQDDCITEVSDEFFCDGESTNIELIKED